MEARQRRDRVKRYVRASTERHWSKDLEKIRVCALRELKHTDIVSIFVYHKYCIIIIKVLSVVLCI